MRLHLTHQWRGLKQSGFADKPWYLVLGRPGAGKTTVLQTLGLRTVAESATSASQCNIWVGDNGVFFDTPGRYSQGGAAQAEWLGFLRFLRSKRSARPAHGVILAVDVQDLTLPEASYAPALRQQLQDVVDVLGVAPPTYLLFTQCSKMAGFAETFAGLDDPARQQIFGFTLSQNTGPVQVQECARRFDELAQALRAHSTLRLDATELTRRQPVFLFPQQFARLRHGLVSLIQALFRPAGFGPTACCRGAYFCDVATAPAPSNKLVPSHFAGLTPLMPVASTSQCYFLGDLFERVLPRDGQKPARLTRHGLAGVWQRHRTTLLIATAVVLLLAFQLQSFVRNYQSIEDAEHAISALHQERRQTRMPQHALAALRKELDRVLDQREATPVAWRWGLYQGEELATPLAATYAQGFHDALLSDLLEADVSAMRALWKYYELRDTAPDAAQYAAAAQRLKAHLLLTQPRDPGEPPLDDAQITWLASTLLKRWTETQAVEPSDDMAGEIFAYLKTYARLVKLYPDMGPPRQPQLVSRVRAILARVSLADALLDELSSNSIGQVADVSLQDILGGGTPIISGHYAVPGIFTRAGWEKLAEPWLRGQTEDSDGWVFDRRDAGQRDARQQAIEVRSRYFARYIETWQRFIDGLTVAAPRGANATLAGLQSLTRGEPPPYNRLFAAIADNTRLVSQSSKGVVPAEVSEGLMASVRQKLHLGSGAGLAAAKIAQAQGRKTMHLDAADVEASFADLVSFGVAAAGDTTKRVLPLDAYQDQVIAVRNALQSYLDNPREADALLQLVQTARNTTRSLIEQCNVGSGARPRLEALLLTPLVGVSQDLVSGARAHTGSSWCTSVVEPYRHLSNRYPFVAHGPDAALSDVAEFFRPQSGTVWAFYTADLQQDIVQHGDRFAFDDRMGGIMSRAYAPAILKYLERAHAVSRALYAPSQVDAGAQFEVRFVDADFGTVTLDLDGQHAVSTAGRWQRLSWPGPERGQGATLSVKDKAGVSETMRQEGEWGLFRLLEDGTLQGDPSSGTFSVVWNLATQGNSVTMEVRLLRRDTPFFDASRPGDKHLLGLLRSDSLRPPASITHNGGGCGK